MDCYTLVVLACLAVSASGWSAPYYPVHRHRAPLRVTRFAPFPHRHVPIRHQPIHQQPPKPEQPIRDRPKREHYYDDDKDTSGITGPVHTFVKTDKNANYKWGVRHHVGNKYAS